MQLPHNLGCHLKAPLRLAWFSVPRCGRRYRVLIGLVDFQPSVAINAVRIHATRRFRHADHRNRSGTFFLPRAAELCACGQKFLAYDIPMPPWLSKMRAVPLAIITSIATEYRAAVYDILPAPPGDSAGHKIALIATGLYEAAPCNARPNNHVSNRSN